MNEMPELPQSGASYGELEMAYATLRSQLKSAYDDLQLANATIQIQRANFESVKTALESLIAEMAENESDFLDSDHLKKLADLLDVSLTEEITYEVTLVATVTVEVPRGESRRMTPSDFSYYGLDVSHDSLSSNMDDYEIIEVTEQ